MNEKDVFRYLKDLGCCDACCFRYLGIKNPKNYENPSEYIGEYQEESTENTGRLENPDTNHRGEEKRNGSETCVTDANRTDSDEPLAKRRKWAVCVSCIGILQEETWPECFRQVKEVLEKKRYSCDTFAGALSAPIATIVREKIITLLLKDKFTQYNESSPTPLKEAWKWSCGVKLATFIGKTLDSGAVSPLLITVHMEYSDDLEELAPLKDLNPGHFHSRSRQRGRFTVEFTRRSVEQALEGATLEQARRSWPAWGTGTRGDTGDGGTCTPEGTGDGGTCSMGGKGGGDTDNGITCTPGGTEHGGTCTHVPQHPALCVSVVCCHAPVYFGGRYMKLSRELPQTPWILNGVRMMDSSVQEIIFAPIADFYNIFTEDIEHRLKFISAGREDVDVRCLGSGRPFAIEVSDPTCEPTQKQLESICKTITKDGRVIVNNLQIVNKNELTLLKQGEQTKCKTYEALCIKLSHGIEETDKSPSDPIIVSQSDIDKINSFRNTKPGDEACINIMQRTPIRVLHRRPLLTRERNILDIEAKIVPDHPQLILLKVVTSAGTYIKEFVHGEFGRTTPGLGQAIGASVDILALDVNEVHLQWPSNKS